MAVGEQACERENRGQIKKKQERYCDGTRKQKNSEEAQGGQELNMRGVCEFKSVNSTLESGAQRGAKAGERDGVKTNHLQHCLAEVAKKQS